MRSILATGVLWKDNGNTLGRSLPYSISYLSEKHLPLIMKLQEIIVQNLGRKDLLQPFSSEFMKQHMGSRGVVLGVFVKNRLIAFRNIYYPAPDDAEWNLGLDIGLAGKELCQVANLQMVCVLPRFRGNSLALRMNQVALGLLLEKGIHPNVCATVSPYNIWNIRILLGSGFTIRKLKRKYGGKLRYIVHQKLRQDYRFDDRSAIVVRLTDFRAQEKWFEAGFYGTGLCRRKDFFGDSLVEEFDLVLKVPVREASFAADLATCACRPGDFEVNAFSMSV